MTQRLSTAQLEGLRKFEVRSVQDGIDEIQKEVLQVGALVRV